jgi:hypothetical protein
LRGGKLHRENENEENREALFLRQRGRRSEEKRFCRISISPSLEHVLRHKTSLNPSRRPSPRFPRCRAFTCPRESSHRGHSLACSHFVVAEPRGESLVWRAPTARSQKKGLERPRGFDATEGSTLAVPWNRAVLPSFEDEEVLPFCPQLTVAWASSDAPGDALVVGFRDSEGGSGLRGLKQSASLNVSMPSPQLPSSSSRPLPRLLSFSCREGINSVLSSVCRAK